MGFFGLFGRSSAEQGMANSNVSAEQNDPMQQLKQVRADNEAQEGKVNEFRKTALKEGTDPLDIQTISNEALREHLDPNAVQVIHADVSPETVANDISAENGGVVQILPNIETEATSESPAIAVSESLTSAPTALDRMETDEQVTLTSSVSADEQAEPEQLDQQAA
jgi:hypothetical protein